METNAQRARAERFRELHQGPRILVLPNAWDAGTARIFEQAGFPAVATTSAGIASSFGLPDGQRIPREDMLEGSPFRWKRSAPSAKLPRPRRSRWSSMHARMFSWSRWANRPRAWITPSAAPTPTARPAPTACLCPTCAAETIAALVKEIHGPVNILATLGTPPVEELERLGVRRVSVGSGPSRACLALVARIAKELREQGTYTSFMENTLTYADVQRMFGG